VPHVLGGVHGGHAAAPELAAEHVAVAQGVSERDQGVWNGLRRGGMM
jgi:hypothetical protein